MSFIIPFKGRNPSEKAKDNILYRERNIFVMDNHRLALWCWLQELDKNETYNLFHIDAHPDMANSANNTIETKQFSLWDLTINEYQELMQDELNIPLFRWDNYIKALLSFYPNTVKYENTYSATHKVGSTETLANDISSYRLLNELNIIFSDKKFVNENQWIVNIDLDYFFSSLPEKKIMFSLEFIDSFINSINLGLENKLIKVLTIALSPECCGGWPETEKLLEIFTKKLNIKADLFHED